MWTRAQLKDKAKFTFKRNYWRTVLIALLAAFLAGGFSGSSSGSNSISDFKDGFEQGFEAGMDSVQGTLPGDFPFDDYQDNSSDHFFDEIEDMDDGSLAAVIAVVVIVVLIVVLIAIAIGCVLDAFLLNPLELGTKRFFTQNLNSIAQVREVGYAFDHNYMNTVKILFFRDMYIVLWSLLFVIPGIVKAYEYRMIPYLLTDDPNMTKDEAFARSRAMMTGQKWNAFVLDLSFIGWAILGALTFGILNIFYVAPYQNMTNAALYEALRNGGSLPEYSQTTPVYGQPAYGQDTTAAPTEIYDAPQDEQ